MEVNIMINIKDLDKAEVLYALWHNSHAQGMSFISLPKGKFTLNHARDIIEERGYKPDGDNRPMCLYFDYLEGHVIKCDITGDEFDERLYDRDCGDGAADKAIEYVRNGNIEDIRVVPPAISVLDSLFRAAAASSRTAIPKPKEDENDETK